MYIPSIIEREGRNLKSFDIPTKFLEQRKIFLFDEINEETASSVIEQLWWCDSVDSNSDIDLYINSPGGLCSQGFMIKDVMDLLNCKVNTIGVGQCASMGAYLLAGGTGVRKATKSLSFMIHSISSEYAGPYPDLEIEFKQSKQVQEKIMKDLSDFTKGKTPVSKIKKLCERDCYIPLEKAIELGFIDEIATK